MATVMSERVYGGLSPAERVRQRRERLLEAARTVIRREGLHQTTYRAVRTESGLTARYFYESYANLEALLLDLVTELSAVAQGRVLEAVLAAPDTAEEKVRAAIGTFVDLVDSDPLLLELAFKEAPEHPALAAHRHAGLEAFVDLVVEQASGYEPELAAAVPPEQVRHAATMANGGFFEVLRQRAEGRLALSRDEVVDYTSGVFLAIADGLRG